MNADKAEKIDAKENSLFNLDKELLEILLKDRTSNNNIIWAVNDYFQFGKEYTSENFITVESIIENNDYIIKPRIEKTKNEKAHRIKYKGEVFTPSWICNIQNNLIDELWFGRKNVFNKELDKSWHIKKAKVYFPKDKSWQDYVSDIRMEITCGEAPYLTSRYDAVTGECIKVPQRIGLLDRKLRIISENVTKESEWKTFARKAVQSIYGYDWQGDNVLLARKNVLYTVIEHYEDKYKKGLSIKYLKELAKIISWNIWQMDGLTYVIPNSYKKNSASKYKLSNKNIGLYCRIMDWQQKKQIRFCDIIKRNI